MARPNKRGLEYFPMDVDIFSDRKFRPVRTEYGYLSVVVYQCLLCDIYRDTGYYMRFGQVEDVALCVADQLNGPQQPGLDTISNVIKALVSARLFDAGLFARGILTSRRIQETFYLATTRRRRSDVDPELWVLSPEETANLSPKNTAILQRLGIASQPRDNCDAKTRVNATQTEVNAPQTGVNAAFSTQTETEIETETETEIETESKQKQKVNPQGGWSSVDGYVNAAQEYFSSKFGTVPDGKLSGLMRKAYDSGMALGHVKQAVEDATKRSPNNPSAYTATILEAYIDQGGAPRLSTGNQGISEFDPLADWELEWLKQQEARKRRLKKEG